MFLKFESRIQTLEFMIHVKWTELRIHKKNKDFGMTRWKKKTVAENCIRKFI